MNKMTKEKGIKILKQALQLNQIQRQVCCRVNEHNCPKSNGGVRR